MKHIFVINPLAGSGVYIKELRDKIGLLMNKGIDVEIHETTSPNDATLFVKEYCESTPNETIRFYACGGDGTIKQVVDGMIGFENAELSCYPCGSGNDFVKCFGGKEAFYDLEKLVCAPSKNIDVIKVNDQYSINVINFGFDTCVAKVMSKVRRRKFIGGKRAYYTGVVVALFKAMKNRAIIYADGERIDKEKFLLCTVSNGQYVGGSFNCAPKSKYDDGEFDVCLVNCISVIKFLSLIKYYVNGTHLDNDKFKKIITYRRARTLEIKAQKGFEVTVDGEIIDGESFKMEIVPSVLKFASTAFCNEKLESTAPAESVMVSV